MHIYILFGCIHIYDRTYIYIVWDCFAVCVTSQVWRSIIGLRGWVGRSEGVNWNPTSGPFCFLVIKTHVCVKPPLQMTIPIV